MDFVHDFWNQWLLLAFSLPISYAITNLIFVYFSKYIYSDKNDEYTCTVIGGIFQIIPWVLVPLGIINFHMPNNTVCLLALLGGALFILSSLFYIKAIFIVPDTSLLQLLWNLCIPLVPFLSFFLTDEVLSMKHYMGIFITLIGSVLLSFDHHLRMTGNLKQLLLLMLAANLCLSLSMIAQGQAYRLFPDFWSIYLMFSLGCFIATLPMTVLTGTKRVIGLTRKYYFQFILLELIALFGMIGGQRAISLTPSVSFVILIESLVPVFIALFSFFVFLFFSYFWKERQDIAALYQIQFSKLGLKLVSLLFMLTGIYLIS